MDDQGWDLFMEFLMDMLINVSPGHEFGHGWDIEFITRRFRWINTWMDLIRI